MQRRRLPAEAAPAAAVMPAVWAMVCPVLLQLCACALIVSLQPDQQWLLQCSVQWPSVASALPS